MAGKERRLGGPTVARPSARDAAASRDAGVTKDRQMKETERHNVMGKGKGKAKGFAVVGKRKA